MSKRLLVAAAAVAVVGVSSLSAYADVAFTNPPVGTKCAGVTGGTTHAGPGGVSNSGTSFYVGSVGDCV